jgi:hypothetical protein
LFALRPDQYMPYEPLDYFTFKLNAALAYYESAIYTVFGCAFEAVHADVYSFWRGCYYAPAPIAVF